MFISVISPLNVVSAPSSFSLGRYSVRWCSFVPNPRPLCRKKCWSTSSADDEWTRHGGDDAMCDDAIKMIMIMIMTNDDDDDDDDDDDETTTTTANGFGGLGRAKFALSRFFLFT
jgi:hypothetical protein